MNRPIMPNIKNIVDLESLVESLKNSETEIIRSTIIKVDDKLYKVVNQVNS